MSRAAVRCLLATDLITAAGGDKLRAERWNENPGKCGCAGRVQVESRIPVQVAWKRSIRRRHQRRHAGRARRPYQSERSVSAPAIEQHGNEYHQPGAVAIDERLQPLDPGGRNGLDFLVGQGTWIDHARKVHQPAKVRQQAMKNEVSHFRSCAPEVADVCDEQVGRLPRIQSQFDCDTYARRRDCLRAESTDSRAATC